MLYIICPTCNKLLGNLQIIYETQLDIIFNSNNSEQQKDEKRIELLSKLVDNYCCKSRLISYRNLVEYIK